MVALASTANGQVQRTPAFEPAAVFTDNNGSYPFGIDAADAIGMSDAKPDGYPDVVFAIGQISIYNAPNISHYTEDNGYLAVYRNLQDWSTPSNGLAPYQLIDLGPETAPGEVKWAQMTDDTNMDIVVAVGISFDGMLYLYHGNGNGGFTIDCSGGPDDDVYFDDLILGFMPKGLDVGNLNGGTKPDVVVTDTNSNRVVCLLGKGDGTLQFNSGDSRYFYSVGADRPMRVVIADMDQDGFMDIITSNHGEAYDAASISVLINKFSLSLP